MGKGRGSRKKRTGICSLGMRRIFQTRGVFHTSINKIFSKKHPQLPEQISCYRDKRQRFSITLALSPMSPGPYSESCPKPISQQSDFQRLKKKPKNVYTGQLDSLPWAMRSLKWLEHETEHGVSVTHLIAPPENWNTFSVLLTQVEEWALKGSGSDRVGGHALRCEKTWTNTWMQKEFPAITILECNKFIFHDFWFLLAMCTLCSYKWRFIGKSFVNKKVISQLDGWDNIISNFSLSSILQRHKDQLLF